MLSGKYAHYNRRIFNHKDCILFKGQTKLIYLIYKTLKRHKRLLRKKKNSILQRLLATYSTKKIQYVIVFLQSLLIHNLNIRELALSVWSYFPLYLVAQDIFCE